MHSVTLLMIAGNVFTDNENGTLWQNFLSVALDPAHILSELAFSVVFDGFVIAFGWGVVFKKYILPKIRKDLRKEIHDEIDEEHGVAKHD
jgi:hypothetical protein